MLRLILSLALAAGVATGAPAFAQSMAAGAMPSCSSGDPVVWVNSSTRVYHMQGDSYFGKTKHGMYLCKSAADAKNYKAAGTHASKSSSGASAGTNMNTTTTRDAMPSGAAPGTNMSPDSAPSPMASGMMMSGPKHKHHHKHSKMQASPSPAMMPSPAAT